MPSFFLQKTANISVTKNGAEVNLIITVSAQTDLLAVNAQEALRLFQDLYEHGSSYLPFKIEGTQEIPNNLSTQIVFVLKRDAPLMFGTKTNNKGLQTSADTECRAILN